MSPRPSFADIAATPEAQANARQLREHFRAREVDPASATFGSLMMGLAERGEQLRDADAHELADRVAYHGQRLREALQDPEELMATLATISREAEALTAVLQTAPAR